MADGMSTIDVNGVALGVEHFGDATAPLILLVGGTTMLSWPTALCAALASGGHHVVRYDLRDSGASTTVDPESPAYTLRDLASDAAACACHKRVPAALRIGRIREDALDFADRAASYRETRAFVRQVEEARWALHVHRSSNPRRSAVDFARRLVSALESDRSPTG